MSAIGTGIFGSCAPACTDKGYKTLYATKNQYGWAGLVAPYNTRYLSYTVTGVVHYHYDVGLGATDERIPLTGSGTIDRFNGNQVGGSVSVPISTLIPASVGTAPVIILYWGPDLSAASDTIISISNRLQDFSTAVGGSPGSGEFTAQIIGGQITLGNQYTDAACAADCMNLISGFDWSTINYYWITLTGCTVDLGSPYSSTVGDIGPLSEIDNNGGGINGFYGSGTCSTSLPYYQPNIINGYDFCLPAANAVFGYNVHVTNHADASHPNCCQASAMRVTTHGFSDFKNYILTPEYITGFNCDPVASMSETTETDFGGTVLTITPAPPNRSTDNLIVWSGHWFT